MLYFNSSVQCETLRIFFSFYIFLILIHTKSFIKSFHLSCLIESDTFESAVPPSDMSWFPTTG